jgi:hypothetical protein
VVSVEFKNGTFGKYTGPVIDINYQGENGESDNDRLFPIDPDRLRTRYAEAQKNSNMQWMIDRYPSVEKYVTEERGQSVSNKVRDVLACFLTAEQVDAFLSEVGTLINPQMTEHQAFQVFGQQFAKKFNENPANATKDIWLARGYVYNADYPSGPRQSKDCKPWIYDQPFNFPTSKQFKLTPFGKGNSDVPSQNSDVEADF